MSGHSKWSSIKHRKAVVDSRRGQQFTKLARAITVAARDGGGDAGAEDIIADGDIYEIVSGPGDLGRVRAALQAAGVEIEQAEVVQRPTSQVPVEEADAARLLRLIDDLEADDDVNAVHANFDAAAEVLERAAAAR